MNVALKVVFCCAFVFFKAVFADTLNESPASLSAEIPSDTATAQQNERAYFANTRTANVTADMADFSVNQYIKLYITKQNGRWVFSEDASLKDKDSELLLWSPADHLIFLGASGKKFFINGVYRCIKALHAINTDGSRGKAGYDVCESNFLAHTNIGLSVITGIFSLGLQHYAFYEIDQKSMLEALNQLPQTKLMDLAAAQRMTLENQKLQDEARSNQLQAQAEQIKKFL